MNYRKTIFGKNKNLEVIKSLKDTIKKNSHAIDFIGEVKSKMEDRLKYNEHDEEAKYYLEQYEYIGFTLLYLDKQYTQALKKTGGAL